MKKCYIGLSLIIFLFSCSNQEKIIKPDKINVITTLFPLYDFARQIGRDKVNVRLLLSPGVESHSFEPTPRDMILIDKADIFIYTGKYMEVWVEQILGGIKNRKLIVVDTSKGIKLLQHNQHAGHHKGKSHHHTMDPHIWLDFKNAQEMVKTITAAFLQIDADNTAYYLKNREEYMLKLKTLDEQFRQTLKKCRYKTIIYAGHFAFGYFVKRYNLKHLSPYQGFAPDSEPTSHNIIELIEFIKKEKIKYLFYEELLNPRIARTIAEETGARILLLHSAHNISRTDLKQGVSFISLMEKNLNQLKTGLEYKNDYH